MTRSRLIVGAGIVVATIAVAAGWLVYRALQEEKLLIVNETDNAMHIAMDDFSGSCVEGSTIAQRQAIELTKKSDFFCANAMLTFSGGQLRSVSCTWNHAHANQPIRIYADGVSCPTTTPVPAPTRSP